MSDDSGNEDKIVPFPPRGRRKQGCAICGGAVTDAHRPFCSVRCAQIDLGRWLKESYRIPAEEAPGDLSSAPDDED